MLHLCIWTYGNLAYMKNFPWGRLISSYLFCVTEPANAKVFGKQADPLGKNGAVV